MSLDGIVLNNVSRELNDVLSDCRISKIHQPEKDEIHFSIRSHGKNLRLLLSASSNNPRVYFTEFQKSNPDSPPMFCMLLRKHIQGGRILNIEQVSLERILKISFESTDELGNLSIKDLIIEIMGKHSNIILVDRESNEIIDSIKRIPLSISTVRQVLPGMQYTAPPSQDKTNPLGVDKKEFLNLIYESEEKITFKFLYKNFLGLSPLVSREMCSRANVDRNSDLDDMSEEDRSNLYNAFSQIYSDVENGKFTPTLIKDEDNYDIEAFSSIDLTQFGDLPKSHFDSVSELLDYYYVTSDKIDRIKQKSNDLRKNISMKLGRAQNKLKKQRQEVETARGRDKYKIYGELIIANIYKISEGDTEAVLDNYYSEDNEKITVKLRNNLTPSENAQRYFKRYNKLKHAYAFVRKEIVKTKNEISYLENILLAIETSTEIDELDEIRDELVKEGYFRKQTSKRKQQKKVSSKPHHYKSSDGFDIYVGKNNKQNDELTLKFADKEDIWLHTKIIPGSHVIIRREGKDIPESTILEAAHLAGFYSKGKMSSNVPIDYTEKKNVRKPNGAKPGMVIYETNSTAYVTPSVKNIASIEKVN